MNDTDLHDKIINRLPYTRPFLFVDKILDVNDQEIIGTYQFRSDESFYSGHFQDNPVTPGVILLEVIGQIGLVCFGIYLLKLHDNQSNYLAILSHLDADFREIVRPGEIVQVHAEKVYFRNNILKCKAEMTNEKKEVVMNATIMCTFKMPDE